MIWTLLLSFHLYADTVAYTKDIVPIFEKRCASCHKYLDGKNWMHYDTAKKFALSIKAKLLSNEMPPGNSTGLTDSERLLIIQWVDQGTNL